MSTKVSSAEKPAKKRKKLKSVETIKKKIEGSFVAAPETGGDNATPPLPGFNLAGRPDFLKNKRRRFKKKSGQNVRSVSHPGHQHRILLALCDPLKQK